MSKWREMREQDKSEEIKAVEEEYPPLEALEEDLEQTLDNIDVAFRERATQERQRYAETCDSIYYFTVFFSNREQLQEFCETFGMDYTQFYFDGRDLARKFKRALKAEDSQFRKTQPFNKDYISRAR